MLLRELIRGGPGIPNSRGPLDGHFGSEVYVTKVYVTKVYVTKVYVTKVYVTKVYVTKVYVSLRKKLPPSLEHGVPPLQASFEVLRCGTLFACLAHRLGALV